MAWLGIQSGLFAVDDTVEANSHLPFVQMCRDFLWNLFTPVAVLFYAKRYEELRSRANNNQPAHVISLFDSEGLPDTSSASPQLPSGCSSSAGRNPVPFWPLFRAFCLIRLMRMVGSARDGYFLCMTNPLFLKACGFDSLPSYRTFARFDHIMTQYGLWAEARKIAVLSNFEQGVFVFNGFVAVDTTHVEAEASAPKKNEKDEYVPNPHDDNVGVLRKSPCVTYIAHKMSLVSAAGCDVPLLGKAFYGNMADVNTLQDTLNKLKSEYPYLTKQLSGVLADGVYGSEGNINYVAQSLGAKLLSPINPGKRKDVPLAGVTGLDHIDKYGRPVCLENHPMVLCGRRVQKEQYIWGCPAFHPDRKVDGCTCSPLNHAVCCNLAPTGRLANLSRGLSPQINWELPEHGATFKNLYNMRTGIERINGDLKEGFGFRHFEKRGRINADAHIDKAILSYHILARFAVLKDRPDKKRSWSTLMAEYTLSKLRLAN